MVKERAQRRLAAILAADVVGYSRLMGQEESSTLATLKARRTEVLKPIVDRHQGRIFKFTGDGVLVEFGSAVNAVQCAVQLQHGMAAANSDLPESRHIVLRIGINLGDVMVEGSDLYGDGINIAARLETIAEPGGIVVSATAYDHVKNKVDTAFKDLGTQSLKNIAEVVRVYRVTGTPRVAVPTPQAATDKPSIAVLPFTNMSGDPEQEYFADGITEDIITDLSKVSGLLVIARNSVFTYKGKPADVQEVGKRFNVTTVLEGSVRKAGQRVRINSQLINARDGTHIWADRYDRDLTDIFAIQDEITNAIVEQLKVRLLPQEKKALEAAPTQNIDAYNYCLQGRHFYYLHTTPHVLLAQRLFGKAVELDKGYARAYAGLAYCAWFLYINHHEASTVADILETSSKALEVDPDLAEAHVAQGLALTYSSRHQEAAVEFNRAIALDPNLFDAYYHYTELLTNVGDWETAAKMYARASELAPDDWRCPLMLSQMYQNLGRDAESSEAARIGLERAERALAAHPDVALPAVLGATALARRGDRTRALEWVSRALTIAPDDPLTQYNAACAFCTLGELDRAIDLLERWTARANAESKTWIVQDTDLDVIRDHPRYQKLLERLE